MASRTVRQWIMDSQSKRHWKAESFQDDMLQTYAANQLDGAITNEFVLKEIGIDRTIDLEFVTSAKKFANFNEFSEIKKKS